MSKGEASTTPAPDAPADPTPEPSVVVGPDLTFEQLYAAERRGMLALAIALSGRVEIAEELVQEAFLRAHRNWRHVQSLDRPGAWVRRVLLNLATSRARRAAVEARGLLRLGGQRHAHAHAAPADAATVEFWTLVRSLPARQAQVVALYYGEDRSTADIAQILEMAEGTVRAQLANARRSLAERLGLETEEPS